jgi:hypothetical protein
MSKNHLVISTKLKNCNYWVLDDAKTPLTSGEYQFTKVNKIDCLYWDNEGKSSRSTNLLGPKFLYSKSNLEGNKVPSGIPFYGDYVEQFFKGFTRIPINESPDFVITLPKSKDFSDFLRGALIMGVEMFHLDPPELVSTKLNKQGELEVRYCDDLITCESNHSNSACSNIAYHANALFNIIQSCGDTKSDYIRINMWEELMVATTRTTLVIAIK